MPKPRQPKAPKLTERDYLAIDRTHLANERTFLAYLRTSFGAVITGVSFIKFFPGTPTESLGWFCFPLAVLILGWGLRSMQKTRQKMREMAR